jgi:hypothetical protein
LARRSLSQSKQWARLEVGTSDVELLATFVSPIGKYILSRHR